MYTCFKDVSWTSWTALMGFQTTSDYVSGFEEAIDQSQDYNYFLEKASLKVQQIKRSSA